ncbi:hypothetical protein BBP40_006888 [Aspergillus hancockii]|nr:hypothetical protein BBP40_006888 [Aspergillus hancockii]
MRSSTTLLLATGACLVKPISCNLGRGLSLDNTQNALSQKPVPRDGVCVGLPAVAVPVLEVRFCDTLCEAGVVLRLGAWIIALSVLSTTFRINVFGCRAFLQTTPSGTWGHSPGLLPMPMQSGSEPSGSLDGRGRLCYYDYSWRC